MCEGDCDCCDCDKCCNTAACWAFITCQANQQNTNYSRGPMGKSNDDDDENNPLTGNDGNKESPGTKEMSCFKF